MMAQPSTWSSSSWSSSSWSSNWTPSTSWWSSWQTQWQWQEEHEETENEVQVEEWPWPGESTTSSTTTSTTSSSSPSWWEPSTLPSSSLPPNHGLYPEVRELEPGELDAVWLMQLTNSERATLQENGVTPATVQRIETLLETMDRQQQEGRGPEVRWALGCFLNRASEATDALDAILGVLQRRLLPRGFVPIRRVPRNEQMRLSLFNWARNQRVILEGILGRHLDVGLVPGDNDLPPAEGGMAVSVEPEHSPASVVATEAAASSPVEAVSITPSVSANEGFGRGVQNSSSDERSSHRAVNSRGEMVSVPSADEGAEPRGPPPPAPVGSVASALAGGLHGVWFEPEGDLATDPGASSSSSSSSSSGRNADENGSTVTTTTSASCSTTMATTASYSTTMTSLATVTSLASCSTTILSASSLASLWGSSPSESCTPESCP